MEVEAVTGNCGHVFGELGVVRVQVVGRGLGSWGLLLGLLGLLLGAVEGGERGLDAELALAAAALRGGFLRGGEGEQAEGHRTGGRPAVPVRDGCGSQVGQEGGFGESHAMLWPMGGFNVCLIQR